MPVLPLVALEAGSRERFAGECFEPLEGVLSRGRLFEDYVVRGIEVGCLGGACAIGLLVEEIVRLYEVGSCFGYAYLDLLCFSKLTETVEREDDTLGPEWKLSLRD